MVWKMKRSSKDKNTFIHSSLRSAGSRRLKSKNPKKSCLRKFEDSMDSDWSNSGSSVSSQRSETFKCDQSSLCTPVSSPRNSNGSSNVGNSSESSRVLSPATESLDASITAKVEGQNRTNAECDLTNSSRASATGTVATSVQKSKSVRFSVVEIRDYERELADNPSCSSGPPIGIGWNHLDSRTVHLNHYEGSRSYRKGQMEMVLTREEREVLLRDWGVQSQQIVLSTRALNKAKNQRRQTVRNLDKAQRVEEGIESATRKLKRVLSRRRSTKIEVKELQRQADLAATVQHHETDESSGEDDSDSETKSAPDVIPAQHPETGEEKDDIDSPVSSLVRTVPTTSISEDGMGAISCISGLTLGNSTTASAQEIERFHRELEIELFGDQQLPSMVGRTLEVDVDIPETDKVYHDPSPLCGSHEPPSIVSTPSWDQGSRFLQQQTNWTSCSAQKYSGVYPVQSMLRRQLGQSREIPLRTSYNHHNGFTFADYQYETQDRYQVANHSVILSRSPDSSAVASPWAGIHQTGSQLLPPYPQRGGHETRSCWSSGPRMDSVPSSSDLEDENYSVDSPRVTHVPLASHLSANNWMEGPTNDRPSLRNQCEAIVISEDDVDDIGPHFVEQRPSHPMIAML